MTHNESKMMERYYSQTNKWLVQSVMEARRVPHCKHTTNTCTIRKSYAQVLCACTKCAKLRNCTYIHMHTMNTNMEAGGTK